MTIRFAPARQHGFSALLNVGATAGVSARVSTNLRSAPRCFQLQAANDNIASPLNDAMLNAALRHFARYGLAAAERARDIADVARLSNDEAQCEWWLGICRKLDRRMADAYARRIAQSAG